MNPRDLIQISLYFCMFTISSVGYGSAIIRKALSGIGKLGTSLLIGMGIIGTAGMILGIFNEFEKVNLEIIIATGLVLAATRLVKRRKQLNFNSIKLALRKDWLASLLLVPILAIAGSLYLSAMQPPMATDELHYHFPQAREIVESKSINWLKGVPDFWVAIPKLMEVIFAEGLAVNGFSLAHALNYAVMIGLLITVFGIVQKRYGIRAAAISTLLILLFEDFTWNGTVGFVDTATTSFELASLLVAFEWSYQKQKSTLVIAGILMGFALSIKYSPFPTALFVTIFVLVRDWRRVLYFAVPAAMAGGYWYLRNWISLGNPFYPMYFGHQGMTDVQYLDVMSAVWQWQPKTWSTFINLVDRYKTPGEMTTYAAIFAPLLSLFFMKKDKGMLRWLLLYYLLYVPYWFFFASHQIRFLATGLATALLITGILLAKIPKKIFAVGLIALLIYAWQARPYPERNLLQHYAWTKLHAVERQYALGNLTYDQVLTREFGCAYETIAYLNGQGNQLTVVDNWTQWQGPSTKYFARGYVLKPFPYGKVDSVKKLWEKVKTENIGYLYRREDYKAKSLADSNQLMKDYVESVRIAEPYLLEKASLVYEKDPCLLYRLTAGQ